MVQAIYNRNLLVDLFQLDRSKVFESVSLFKITNLSATPTFYRLLLPADRSVPSVSRLTSGGEKLDSVLAEKMKVLFPNAKVTNIYASTEAGSLFSSVDGEAFTLPDHLREYVRINDDELYLHISILGDSLKTRSASDWFATGDVVDIIDDQPLKFKFRARKGELINVGGIKVNPHSIEQLLRELPEITDARVFGRSNSLLGEIVAAEIVLADSFELSDLKKLIRAHITGPQCPRKITVVQELTRTRTGKLART